MADEKKKEAKEQQACPTCKGTGKSVAKDPRGFEFMGVCTDCKGTCVKK